MSFHDCKETMLFLIQRNHDLESICFVSETSHILPETLTKLFEAQGIGLFGQDAHKVGGRARNQTVACPAPSPGPGPCHQSGG